MSYRTKRQTISKDECPLPTKRRKGRPSTLQEEEEASSLDTQSGSRSDMKIPSSIYNTRTTTDAPAELFRKDLISAMKLPDSEQLSTDAYWIISDQWKQEWERGVQVPVNPDSLPGSSVHEVPVVCLQSFIKSPKRSPSSYYHSQRNEFKLPKHKYIRITKDEHFKTEEHQLSLLPLKAEKSCSYDMDDVDTAWLKLCNGERSLGGLPKIKDDQFEHVMEELEMRCWEKVQTIIKEEEGLGIEYDENVICDVCRSPDSEDGNEMVFCDNCNICVHQACYGITTIPSGSWLCRTCTLRFRPECVLCPNKNGAMKCTRSGHKWAHVSCALWIPEVSIGCVEKMEPITKISSIPPSRWALICVLCRERVGACIQCSVKTCKTAYHVTCAFKHGLEMRAIIEDESAEDGVKLRSYCQKHSVTSKKDRNSGSEDEDSTKRKRKDMTSEEKNQARAAKLHEIEGEFEKHVNVIDVTQCRDVDNDGVLYIYNYWVLKRRSGNNRPLLLPKSDDGDLLGRQQEQADLEKLKMFVQLRQDLERVRNLCYMVSRREKLSRNLLSLREQTFHKQIAVLSDSKINLSSAEVSAVQEANHGPSIYDRLYSYPDAPDLSTDFETMLSRIAGAVSPEKSNYSSLKWPSRDNPYKRSYVNGSMRYSSMSSSSDIELKPPRIISSEQTSMDEAKLIKSMLKHKLKEKRLNKKRSKTKRSTDSSTEEESDKVKPKWSASPNKKLLQVEKQFGSDSGGESLPKLLSKRPIKINNIYSDSDSEMFIKKDTNTVTHTKAAVKEFSQGKSKNKTIKDKSTLVSKIKETSLDKDIKKIKKEDVKSNPTVPSELIVVPQRQAAKKATESIHRVHGKHEEISTEKKSPEKLLPVNKKSPEIVVPNVKSPDKQQPIKINKIKNTEKLSSVEKESDSQDLFSFVPQRQAAKKAIQGIKSGMTKPVEETKVPEPVKKEESNKLKRNTKSSLSSTSSSSSSSSSSSTSTSSSTSSSSGSSTSDSDTEPEKKVKPIDHVNPLKEVSKTKSPPKAKGWLSENKPMKISSSSSSESDKDQKVIRAPDKKLKTSDRRPEHRFQDPPPKREESRRESIGSDRCDTVQVVTCGDSSIRSDGNRKSSDSDHIGTSTSQSDGIKLEPQQPIHAVEDKEIEKKLKLDEGDQRVLKEDHGLNINIQEIKNKNVTPVQHTSDKENKKTDELNLYLPGGHRLNDLKEENVLSSSFLTRQDIERELVNNIDYDKKFSKMPFNCNNHFPGGQRSIFSPQQCNKDITDIDFDNDMIAVEQAANEEGFGLTRDTDVRNAPLSFSFNNEFLFKDDSKEVTARETLNLVEKLRLGITKISVPLENENIELINEPSKVIDPLKDSESGQKTENTLYNAYNKFHQQSNELVDVNKVPERDKLDRSESALSDERWVPPSQRSQAESPYQDINDANRWSDSIVMPSRRSDTSNEPSPEHREPTTTASSYQPIHPFPTSVPLQMDNLQFSQYSDPSFILNPPPTSNQLSFMSSSRSFNQQFTMPPPFSSHPSLIPELNKPLHLQTPCTAAFTSSTQNMAFTAAMISPMTHHDNFMPPFNDMSLYSDNNLLMCASSNNLSLPTESVMHNVLNAISQASNMDNQISSLPTSQPPRVSICSQGLSSHNIIPASINNQTQIVSVQSSTSNHHQVPVTSHNQTELTPALSISNNQEPVISQTKVVPSVQVTTTAIQLPTHTFTPTTIQAVSKPDVLTSSISQVEVSQNINNQTLVQTPISISQVSNQTAPSIPTPKQSPALPTTPLPERSPMSIIASSPSLTSSPHPNRTPSDKKSPSKATRSSSRVSAQSYKSPDLVDRSPEVKKQNKRGPRPQSKTSGRGRGRGRGRSSNHFTDYNPAVSKLAGTAYDLDFVEEFENDNNGVMENLRAMRERKKSDVKVENKSPVSPKVHSSPNNYRRKHASVKELKPPSPIVETNLDDPLIQSTINELSPMLPGPVDMRTYNSYDSITSYSDNIYDTNTNIANKVTDMVNILKEDLQSFSKLTTQSKDKDIEDQLNSIEDQITIVKPPLPVEKEPVASSTVLQSESRNQLKVKIKGPFLNAKYNNVQHQPILPTIDTSAISMNIPSHSVPPLETPSLPSNFRQMRKKELLRQYCNQQDNIEQTTNHPIVPPLSRNIITIPKAVASMTTIPTKEDYKAVVDANMEKKRTKYGFDDPKSNYINNIRKCETITPKLKIKIGEQPMVTTMEEKRSLRPPKKRICDTQNDETNHLIAPTMEQLRRDSMKFRKKVFARFEEDALASSSISVTPSTTKNKKKRRSSPSVSRKKKPRINKEISQVQVIEAKQSTPKLIIRFSKAAPDEAEVSEVKEPKKASPIKLKISRCKEGYVMKPPSNQTTTDTSLNNNCEVR